jgi:FkbM family methyltransferase
MKALADSAGLRPLIDGYRWFRTPEWVRRNKRDEAQLRAVLAAVLAKDSSCVDVGAANGAILREIVRVAPFGRHVAFEPRPDDALRLRREFPGVEVRQAALSDTSGYLPFTLVTNLPQLSGFSPRAWPHAKIETEAIDVTVERLDEVVGDRHVSLIKIDVEGAELAVLRGAMGTLGSCRPLIVLEHGGTTPGDPNDPEHGEIFDLLAGDRLGLRIFDIDGVGPLTKSEFAAASASGAMWSFMARP